MATGVFRGCRYCGASDRTREHALATQLATLIPQPESMTAERVRVEREASETLSEWTTPTPANVIVRDFCSGCNSGWMNELDWAIKSDFAELCAGRALTLDSDRIALWSSWVVKQFFSYSAAYPDDYSRPMDYRAFYASRTPLPGMHVYIGLGADLPWPHIHLQRPMFVAPALRVDAADRRVGLQLWTTCMASSPYRWSICMIF